jgi:hypothetical protein
MVKSEVRIITHKLTFTLKMEQVPLRYRGFKMVHEVFLRGLDEVGGGILEGDEELTFLSTGLLLTSDTSPLCLIVNGL